MKQPHHDLPLLGAIAGLLHWLESLAIIASGPLLTVGLGIALVDLLTDGQLLTSAPWLLYTWAIAQAVGVDAQLVGSAFNAGHALRSRRYLVAVAYSLLVIALGYVGFIAAEIFATQEATGTTTVQALSALGLDGTSWILQRSLLSVVLVVLSGLLRYVQPAKEQASIEDERAQLQRELELEPLRQRARAMKATGMATLARSTIAAIGRTPTYAPPTGPGSPIVATPDAQELAAGAKDVPRLRAVSAPRKRRGVRTPNTRTATVERAVRAVYTPGMTVGQLQKAAKISRNSASKWRKIMIAEAEASAQSEAQEWAV